MSASPSVRRRVLLVARALPAHVPGGLERHVQDLALGLAGAEVELHLLTHPLDPAASAPLRAAGLTLHFLPTPHPGRYTLAWLRGVGPLIQALHQRHRFSLIHGQEFALGCWRPRPGDPPLVLSVHGTITSETPLHPDAWRELPWPRRPAALLRYGRRFLFQPAWRRQLRAAARVLIDSAFTRGELIRALPELEPRLALIPLAVRPAAAAPPDYAAARRELGWDDRPRLLTLGRLEWQKGHGLALDALARLTHRAWHYVIGGAGGEAPRLRRQVDRLGLTDRVTFAGWVDEPAKLRLLAGADLFLWPERTHPAFGLAGLEAMLQGTPVLARRRGAAPEVIGDEDGRRCWIVNEEGTRAVDAWTAALDRLLADPAPLRAARQGLAEATRARFPFQRMIEQVLAEYDRAAGG
ncbi:MAG TPA: glycosyltransferase family 4 protein [Candidatus Sumerlaeota bacterium]|nr:glycosyltransferase family 4 protein [Candidatus Sumerlaeota bacterium]HOR29459.1 glycosyltransferase family 4 protein [Candidatus Sumerlaeota bacterium]